MRALLPLLLAPGCVYSKHLHEYRVDVDSPAAVAVYADSGALVLPAGADATEAFTLERYTVTAARDASGLTLACEGCQDGMGWAPRTIVTADGLAGPLDRGALSWDGATLAWQHRYLLEHHVTRTYELETTSQTWVDLRLQVDDPTQIERITARQHPHRWFGVLLWTAEAVLLVPWSAALAEEDWVKAGAITVPMGVLGWWGLGQLIGPRREIVITERPSAP